MHSRPLSIETPRLQLVALLADELRALIAGNTALAGKLIAAVFPSEWPGEQAVMDGLPWHLGHLEADDSQRAWRVRVIVERSSGTVVGSINLQGPPDKRGDVEVGWGIEPQHRLRGYAAEAADALLHWASAQPRVTSLSATIPDDNLPSQRVALRLGMLRTPDKRRELPLWQRAIAPSP